MPDEIFKAIAASTLPEQNLWDPHRGSYCVRCLVWRPPLGAPGRCGPAACEQQRGGKQAAIAATPEARSGEVDDAGMPEAAEAAEAPSEPLRGREVVTGDDKTARACARRHQRGRGGGGAPGDAATTDRATPHVAAVGAAAARKRLHAFHPPGPPRLPQPRVPPIAIALRERVPVVVRLIPCHPPSAFSMCTLPVLSTP